MKKLIFITTYIFLVSIIFFLFCSSAQANAQCDMLLITDFYSRGYLEANPQNKIMGCDFIEPLSGFDYDPSSSPPYDPVLYLAYTGGVVQWYYNDSDAKPLEFWRYTENYIGSLQPYLYAGADYVIYAIGKNDVALILNCGGYPDNDTLISDHDNFITDVLIEDLGYKRKQIVLFFTGPVAYSASGDPAGTNWEECRADGITDEECVNAMYDNNSKSGWVCDYTNRHLKLITRDFKNLADLKGMPFADMFSWVMNNYDNPDDFIAQYIEGDGFHPDISKNDLWWNVAVSLIEEAILKYNDVDNDGVPDTQDNCEFQFNSQQRDIDGDTVGDACDEDTIYGAVTGEIQDGVTITITKTSCGSITTVAELTTDENGNYAYGGLENGRYFVEASYPGYSFSSGYWVDIPQINIRSYDFTATSAP